MERLKDCMEELVKFTLEAHINETLEFDLGLSKDFCFNLLKLDDDHPNDSAVSLPAAATEPFQGVPQYPLFKRLASALYQSLVSGAMPSSYDKMIFINQENLRQKEKNWIQLIQQNGTELINMLKSTCHELHVQEPFFSYLKDGRKKIEGRIKSQALILVNKSVVLEVEDVHRYPSFLDLLKAESLEKVLPGVHTIEEGVQIYRKFYTEEKEMSNGVLAICVSKATPQPYLSLASILFGLSYDGVQSLLGFANTTGTVSPALPPPISTLLSSFILPYKPNIKGTALNQGARALAKHAERSSSKYWGILSGSDSSKNSFAMDVISRLITSSRWLNIHVVPQHGEVFEIRVADGYGARWSKDGTKFVGFLEPYMEDGHLKDWKH